MIHKILKIIWVSILLFLVLSPVTMANSDVTTSGSLNAPSSTVDSITDESLPEPIFTGGEDPEKKGIEYIKGALSNTAIVSSNSISALIVKYVNFLLPLLSLAAFVGFVYAGVLYVTAYGEEDQVGKAKKIMMYAAIGILLVIFSYSIAQLITTQLSTSIGTP